MLLERKPEMGPEDRDLGFGHPAVRHTTAGAPPGGRHPRCEWGRVPEAQHLVPRGPLLAAGRRALQPRTYLHLLLDVVAQQSVGLNALRQGQHHSVQRAPLCHLLMGFLISTLFTF